MPITKVWYIKAIGRSTKVMEERRRITPEGAKMEKKLMDKQFPKCNVIIIKTKEFIVKIEKKLNLPKR